MSFYKNSIENFKNNISLYKNYYNNFFWLVSEHIIKSLISFFVFVIVINYLGPYDFGKLTFGLTVFGILYQFATLGMDSILFRNIIKYKKSHDKLIKAAYIPRFISGVIIFIITSSSFFFFSEDRDLIILMFILSFGFIVDAFNVYKEYFAANLKNKYIALSGILSNLISIGLNLIFVFAKFGVIWFALVFLLNKFFNVITQRFIYKKHITKKHTYYKKKLSQKMICDSWPMIFTSFTSYLYMYTDQLFINIFIGFEQLGIYATGTKLIIFLYVIPSFISNILYPKIIELHKNHSSKIFLSKIENFYNVCFVIGLMFFIFFFFLGEIIITTLFNEKFSESVNVLIIYSFGIVFVFFESLNNKLLMIDNLQKLLLIRNVLCLSINILLNFILIPKYGIEGAAFATIISQIFMMLSYGLHSKIRYIMFLQIKSFLYPILFFKRIK